MAVKGWNQGLGPGLYNYKAQAFKWAHVQLKR